MSLPSNSLQLAFHQQGSVDWVSLTKGLLSYPVDVLGRLSQAGLQPMTVTVAQGLFAIVPIGVRGEKLLEKTTSGLKSKKIGKVLWVGLGVRHILHELLKTSQGASSVAIISALSEGFSTSFAATVLYELVRLREISMEVRPSYEQWQAYVQTCACVLSTSGLGMRINQLAKLFGKEIWIALRSDYSSGNVSGNNVAATDAELLAKFLLGVGSIQKRETEAISVAGGVACLWGYVICEMMFDIRVQLCGNLPTESGTSFGTAAQNYDANSHNYQICFNVELSIDSAAIKETSRTYSLHQRGEGPAHLLHSSGAMDPTWRVPFDELLHNLLGYELPEDPDARECLAIMFGCHVLIRHASPKSRDYCRYPSAVDLLHQFAARVPDLRPLCMGADAFITGFITQWRDKHTESWESSREKARVTPHSNDPEHDFVVQSFKDDYFAVQKRILSASKKKKSASGNRAFTMDVANAWYLLVEMASICCNLIVEEGLHLSLAGIRRVSRELKERAVPRRFVGSRDQFRDLFYFADERETFGSLLITSLKLFYSESSKDIRHSGSFSAISEGGIFCYARYLNTPLQSHIEACRIHVGCGTISTNEGGRIYDKIAAQDNRFMGQRKYLQAYPSNPQARLLVDEGILGLRVWFEQWQDGQFEERQALNPVTALNEGWYGSKGSWLGLPEAGGAYDTTKNPEALDEEERKKWHDAFS